MSVKLEEIMVGAVVTVRPHHTVGHVKALLERHGISAVPVEGPEGEAVGIVSARDVLKPPDTASVRSVMSAPVVTVPVYSEVSQAARAMRKRRIHHLVVVHEKRIVGIVSSFDLLRLVEEHRFERKEKSDRPGRPRSLAARRQGRHGRA